MIRVTDLGMDNPQGWSKDARRAYRATYYPDFDGEDARLREAGLTQRDIERLEALNLDVDDMLLVAEIVGEHEARAMRDAS